MGESLGTDERYSKDSKWLEGNLDNRVNPVARPSERPLSTDVSDLGRHSYCSIISGRTSRDDQPV